MFTHLVWDILGNDLSQKVGLFRSLVDQAVAGHGLDVSHDHGQNISPKSGKSNFRRHTR